MFNPTKKEINIDANKDFYNSMKALRNIEYNILFEDMNNLNIDKRLFFKALNLTNKDQFYKNKAEIIDKFIADVREDLLYSLEVAGYASTIATMRTSVSIILGTVFFEIKQMNTFEYNEYVAKLKEIIKRKFNHWVKRPDMLGEILYTYQYLGGDIKTLPKFAKKLIRQRIEKFDKKSLTKHRMENRAIKLKDIIKLYRPIPKDKDTSKIYREIIGNKLKLEETEFIRQIARKDSEIDSNQIKKMIVEDSQKIESGNKNKFNIPLSALITNLSKLVRNIDDEQMDLLINRLEDVAENDINIFDLFKLFIPNINQRLRPHLNKIINVGINDISNYTGNLSDGKTDIILDISGSMEGDPLNLAIKYISLLVGLLGNNFNKIYFFNQNLINPYEKNGINEAMKYNYYKVESSFRIDVALKRVLSVFDFHDKPLKIYDSLYNFFDKYFTYITGGTALLRAVADHQEIVKKENEPLHNIIVLTDEMTWVEKLLKNRSKWKNRGFNFTDIIESRERFKNNLKTKLFENTNYIIINVVNQYGLTPFSDFDNITYVGGKNPRILKMFDSLTNFDKVRNELHKYIR